MQELKIYCTSLKYFRILDKLPSYITPLGLGVENFPNHWQNDSTGINLSYLNKYYAELTGLYWVWKNKISDLNDNDWVGTCHYRKLWLNNFYEVKQKKSFDSLYNNLLKPNNEFFNKSDVILVQPIVFKNKTLLSDLNEVHKSNIIEECLNFLDSTNKKNFLNHLNQNFFYGQNMFITKKIFYNEYCDIIFKWANDCHKFLIKENICTGYNTRMVAFLSERFTSYWFSRFEKKSLLSYARLGKFHLSNSLNYFCNPIKFPFTFRMYPTIHKY